MVRAFLLLDSAVYWGNATKGGVSRSMECVGTAIMPPVAAIPANRPNGKTPRASNARPYNQRDNCHKILCSPAGWGHPARDHKIIMNIMGRLVGTAIMPLVAAIPKTQPNGKTARASNARPYKSFSATVSNFSFLSCADVL